MSSACTDASCGNCGGCTEAWEGDGEVAEEALLEPEAVGFAEPFCACGRRWSQCDRSRLGCHTRGPL